MDTNMYETYKKQYTRVIIWILNNMENKPPANIQKQCLFCGNWFTTSEDTPHLFCIGNKFCQFLKWITKK